MKRFSWQVLGLVGLLSCTQPTFALEKSTAVANLDGQYLRSYAETRGFMLGRPVKAKPSPDGKSVLFLRAQARVAKQALYIFDVQSKSTRELLTPEAVLKGAEEHLSAEEKARRERQRISVGGFTDFQLSDDSNLILVSLSGKLYVVDRASNKITQLNTGDQDVLDPKFSPDSLKVSYVQDNDLYWIDLASGKSHRVTTGGSASLTHGLAEFVAQEEMDRFTGYWWSPDSTQIVYEESNSDGVEVWYLADPQHPEQKPTPAFYPRPGKPNVSVRLGVISANGGETRWIDWDSKAYPYLATVTWSESSPLSMVVLNREQKDLKVLEVNPNSGKTAELLKEHDDKWINLQKSMPSWTNNGDSFLWITERDGAAQLELHKSNGELDRILVKKEFGLSAFVACDSDSAEVFFLASKDPTELHLFKTSLNGESNPVQMTKGRGIHAAAFAKNHKIFIHDENPVDAMPKSNVITASGEVLGALPEVAENPPGNVQVEFVELGGEHNYRANIVRPQNFNPQLKYPVIVDVYGGPHKIKVTANKRNFLLDQWLADQGFIIVSIDGRGTPGRGRDWERAICNHFGSVPLDDQVAGLKQLCSKYREMDSERVGITGWSFGGYMSALAVLRRPDVFKVGVAGAPVVDWFDYDSCYTERYLGLPEKSPDAYKEASLLTYVNDLKRPLMLVHGTSDDNVFFKHSLELADALFRAGKDFSILPLSGLTHMVPDPIVMEQLWTRIINQFHTHLGKPAKGKEG